MANRSQRIAEGQLKALIKACNSGKTARFSRLVQVPGMDINKQDLKGETVAHKASNGRAECVRILAETGRDWQSGLEQEKRVGPYSSVLRTPGWQLRHCGHHSAATKR